MNIGALNSVYDPASSTEVASVPALFGFDAGTAGDPARTIYSTFAQNADTSTLPEDEYFSGQLTSTDGGLSFPLSTYQKHQTVQPAGMHSVRLRSGELFSVNFKPLASSSSTVVTFRTRRSVDNGATWQTGTMTYTAPAGRSVAKGSGRPPSIRVSGAPLELADGTIVLPLYAAFLPLPGLPPGNGFTAELAQSSDGGATFTRRSVIAAPDVNDPYYADGDGGYNESFVARRSDGALIAVLRRDYNSESGIRPLRQAVSTDNGLTWSALATSQVDFGSGPAARPGINPQVVLLPNGILALSSGRDDTQLGDNWVAISPNGLGTDWEGVVTFRNCDVSPEDGFTGSGGNTGLAWSDADTLIQATDNCHPKPTAAGTSCTGPSADYTTDNQQRIYRRVVHALIPGVGKIDLAGKLRAGTVSVTGNMTYTSPQHPRTGVAGAFDGSSEYWSSAVSTGAGEMVIALDKTYAINRIGWSLRNGLPESARVYFSTDGVTWGSPVVTGTNRTHYSLRYTSLATPVDAKYVKVEVDPSTQCESGLGTSCAFLNEFALFSTTDSFENDVLLSSPRGWSNLDSCYVSSAQAADSRQVMICRDDATDAQATARYVVAPSTTKTVELKVKPAHQGATLLGIKGKSSAGADVTAFHLVLGSAGEVKWHNGSQWVQIAPPGTIQVGQWRTVSISATTTAATVRLDGQVLSSTVGNYQSATSLVALNVASGGTASVGDLFAVDDVLIE